MSTAIKMHDLLDAFDWVSAAGPFENRAVVSRETGVVYLISDLADMETEELPEDLDDDSRYVDLPHKNDLDLGRQLALRFVDEQLPQSYDRVQGFFAKAGAYGRFKDLLGREGKLEAWYQFEQDETERALREWAADNELQISPA